MYLIGLGMFIFGFSLGYFICMIRWRNKFYKLCDELQKIWVNYKKELYRELGIKQ